MNKLHRIFSIPFRMLSVSHGEWTRCWPKPDYGPIDVQRSVLLNGIKVAAAKPLGAQIGSCTVMYQAGSRFEVDKYLGVTHFVRAASSASSCAFSGFNKMRYMPQHGAAITCTSDRQSISYTLRCHVSEFSEMKCFLLDTVLRNCFKEWEMDDLKPMISDDLHRIHPENRVIDLVQKACWAGPLSNSMYCEPKRIGDITGEILNNYTNCHYKTDHCTVASIGVPFEETMKMAEALEPRRTVINTSLYPNIIRIEVNEKGAIISGSDIKEIFAQIQEKPEPRCPMLSKPRRGCEFYDLGPNADTWICVAVPGCGTNNISCLLKHAIVAAACGSGNMQQGQHREDRTPQLPLGLMAGDDVYTSYRAFNISYSETGVFGIIARTRASTAWNVAVAASEFLTNVGDLNFKQIDIGKRRLKLSLARHDENCVKLTEGLALQLANDIQIDSAKTSMNMVDQTLNDEISVVAQSLSKKYRDMALAIVGDIARVPHDKELICGF